MLWTYQGSNVNKVESILPTQKDSGKTQALLYKYLVISFHNEPR